MKLPHTRSNSSYNETSFYFSSPPSRSHSPVHFSSSSNQDSDFHHTADPPPRRLLREESWFTNNIFHTLICHRQTISECADATGSDSIAKLATRFEKYCNDAFYHVLHRDYESALTTLKLLHEIVEDERVDEGWAAAETNIEVEEGHCIAARPGEMVRAAIGLLSSFLQEKSIFDGDFEWVRENFGSIRTLILRSEQLQEMGKQWLQEQKKRKGNAPCRSEIVDVVAGLGRKTPP